MLFVTDSFSRFNPEHPELHERTNGNKIAVIRSLAKKGNNKVSSCLHFSTS